MQPLLLAAALAGASPTAGPLTEAAHAISAGRLEQARIMINEAVKAGAKGEAVDRLLADLAFESGDYQAALAGYKTLLGSHSGDLFLAERAGIAAVPFEAFGYEGEPGWFRLSVGAVSEKMIDEVLVRLRETLQLTPP